MIFFQICYPTNCIILDQKSHVGFNFTKYYAYSLSPSKNHLDNVVCCYSLQKECNEDCNFKELILENHYNTYASAKWTHSGGEMFVALNQKGVPVRGKKTKKEQKTAHFLPMAIT